MESRVSVCVCESESFFAFRRCTLFKCSEMNASSHILPLSSFFSFFFSPSLALVFEFKHRPCKAFRIVMAIQTHSYTYFNVMHGIFLMNSIVLGSINTSQLTEQSKPASKQVYHCYCCLHLFFSFFFVHKSYENRYISCIV